MEVEVIAEMQMQPGTRSSLPSRSLLRGDVAAAGPQWLPACWSSDPLPRLPTPTLSSHRSLGVSLHFAPRDQRHVLAQPG